MTSHELQRLESARLYREQLRTIADDPVADLVQKKSRMEEMLFRAEPIVKRETAEFWSLRRYAERLLQAVAIC